MWALAIHTSCSPVYPVAQVQISQSRTRRIVTKWHEHGYIYIIIYIRGRWVVPEMEWNMLAGCVRIDRLVYKEIAGGFGLCVP